MKYVRSTETLYLDKIFIDNLIIKVAVVVLILSIKLIVSSWTHAHK